MNLDASAIELVFECEIAGERLEGLGDVACHLREHGLERSEGLDGERVDNACAEDAKFVIGQGQMIEDFDQGVRGLTPGTSTKIDATFPTRTVPRVS